MVEKNLIFFLGLGVFKPVRPKWAGRTSPELVSAGCECFMGEGRAWERRLTKVWLEREAAGELVGAQCGELPFCSQGNDLPERWSPSSF